MKTKNINILFTFVVMLFISLHANSQSGAAINTTGTAADASAILDITSDNAGILIPRMTETQKGLIPSPAIGLMIYQTDGIKGFWYYDGTNWVQSIGATGATGQAGIAGVTGATGAVGATGFLPAGTIAGNTPYWDGTTWIVNSSNIFNNGGSVGIGTNNPDASASLDLGEVSKGLLINRMTTSERNAITSPAEGLQIFNLNSKCIEIYISGMWQAVFCGFICGIDEFYDERDEQTYQTVKIGSQCWLKSNLNYYTPNSWCYDNNTNNCNTYGRLYNWADIMAGSLSSSTNPSGVQGICPLGWHIPSEAEWQQLEQYLGMNSSVINNIGWRGTDQGDQLKSTTFWISGGSATNSSGFSAIPGGDRSVDGSFFSINENAYWWSATDSNSNAFRRHLRYNSNNVYRDASTKVAGLSVRCLRD